MFQPVSLTFFVNFFGYSRSGRLKKLRNGQNLVTLTENLRRKEKSDCQQDHSLLEKRSISLLFTGPQTKSERAETENSVNGNS